MSEPQQGNGTPRSGVDDGAHRRLAPRPLNRPAVDPGQTAVFGRPHGVPGAFADRHPPSPNGNGAAPATHLAPPPPEALTTAFGRPQGTSELLQRPPLDLNGEPEVEPVFWEGKPAGDSWRDPSASAVIGPPAVTEEPEKVSTAASTTPGPQLSVPELLFGRRVKPTALILLMVAALVVGAAGGFVGWLVGKVGNPLTDGGVTLADVQPGKERPVGSVSDIAKRVTPSVVSIEFKGANVAGVGSGVVIEGGGYILTNDHVVAPAVQDTSAKLTVVFTDGKRAVAQVVGRDPKTDLAVIKVQVENPTVLQFGNSDDLAVGDAVLAIGSPLSLSNTVTEGIVSALHRPVTAAGENGGPQVTYDAIQTDAAINPGNSGGALVDSSGTLVGINSSIRTETGGSVGLGFAISGNYARKVSQALIRDGQVKHADMNLNVRSVSAETAEGAKVQNVLEGGAAAAAGIQEEDVITKVGDRMVRNAAELTVAVRNREIGETIPVVLARQGRELTVQVTLRSD
ncbi:trypsin-like peptidase domain-containing protein [Actinosynnema sp. NPDC047251]|uniref:Peptidase, S1/S6 family n=1 Tax=Saccharothrix espanaensis (strain ATCC 51144 / DSM 44229 / JCM 9112 / NBRC 15066 / NRRL 15764) TaxID=1179773 RepID=K0JRX7_SACES|nr:trypsin-like peptidase domain-containing protein [Saccharothrix espanaensis]CCH28212.1 Peptidase, S1/S6 family [Saccharothrix espanaensis DSM 44229]